MAEPLLLATDGGRTAASALRFAAAFAEVEGVPVEVVSVVEPLSELPMPLPHRSELENAHALGVADRVREHVRDVVGPVDWPVHVRLGRPAPAICDAAKARGARMVVLGVDASKPDGTSTAMELLHLTETPVFIARDGALPTSALVGIDFRTAAADAARAALQIVGLKGELHLAHVSPSMDFPAASVWDWGGCYRCAVEDGFNALVAELKETGATSVTCHTLTGDPVAELLRLSEELGVGLLAFGSDGYICNGRVVVGRVARRLIAEARTAILATPVASGIDARLPGGAPGRPVTLTRSS